MKGARHRDHIAYDTTDMKCPEKQIYRDRKWTSGCLGLEGVRGRQGMVSRYGVFFGADEDVLKLDYGDSCPAVCIIESTELCILSG